MLRIEKGDILQTGADALVIPSNVKLTAGPGLSQLAYKFFGEKELTQACQNYLKQKKETLLPYSRVISTKIINNSKFQYVFHAVVPLFDNRNQEFSESQMSRLLENILNEVNNLKINSISIPALGCGMNMYPIDSFLIAFAGVFSENLPKFPNVQFNLVLFDFDSFDTANMILGDLVKKTSNQQIAASIQQQKQSQNSQQEPSQPEKLKNYKEKEQKKIFKFETFNDNDFKVDQQPNNQNRFATQQPQSNQYGNLYQGNQFQRTQNNQGNSFLYRNHELNYSQNLQSGQRQQEQFNYAKKYPYENEQQQQMNNGVYKNNLKQSQQQQPEYTQQNQKNQQQNQNYPGPKRWNDQQDQVYQQNQVYPPPQQLPINQNVQDYPNNTLNNEGYPENNQGNSQLRVKKDFFKQKNKPIENSVQEITQGDFYPQKSQIYIPNYPTEYPPQIIQQPALKEQNIQKQNDGEAQQKPFRYIYLQILLDENSAITNENSLITLILNLCKQIYAVHKSVYETPENPVKKGLNCELTYKIEREINDIINIAPPETIQHLGYIANSSDMFILGLTIYKLIFRKHALPFDFEQCKQILENQQISFSRPRFKYSQEIQIIFDKLLSDSTSERLMPYQVVQRLLTLSNDDELKLNWENLLNDMTRFYKNEKILQQIIDNLKQIIINANKEGNLRQKKVDSEVQLEGPESEIVYTKVPDTLLQQKLQKEFEDSRKDISRISVQSSQQNPEDNNTTLYSLLNADQNKNIQKQAMERNDFSSCQIGCVVIPINKKNPMACLPNYLKRDSKFDTGFQGILQFALKEQEYFIQSFKCQVPILGCDQVIFVFCPDQHMLEGRRVRLQKCYQDILLYAYKCLKVESIFMCLDNIFSLLIYDKTNLSLENDHLEDIFIQACAEMKPDMIKYDKIEFQGQDWIISRQCTPKLVQGKLTIMVEKKDIVTFKGIDVIVNAANKELIEGAGVCGAIFRACGQYELKKEIDMYFQNTGRRSANVSDVIVTDSYNLKASKGAKYVFHAVGPIYNESDHVRCANQLQQCLLNILQKCEELDIESIAIPAISTGIYNFPKHLCAEIFKKTFLTYNLKRQLQVYLAILEPEIYNIFQFIFRDGKYKELIYSQIENIPPTECLVVPINFQDLNQGGVTKRIFNIGGNHLRNQVEFFFKSQQYPVLSRNSIFTCQSFNFKFKSVYNVMFVSGPQNVVQKNINYQLYEVFNEILDTAFTIKKFQSITVVFMAILQQCLPEKEQFETYSGLKSIRIFLDAIKNYKENHQGMIGKITIISNIQQFVDECQQKFIQ